MRIDTSIPWTHRLVTLFVVILVPPLIASGIYMLASFVVFLWILSRGLLSGTKKLTSEDIVYLRSFHDRDANAAYASRVDPILSCFGRTIEVTASFDYQVSTADKIVNAVKRTPGKLGHLQLKAEDWKGELCKILKRVRFVVVDLSTLTENVLWEFEAAVDIMGADKMFVLVRDQGVSAWTKGLSRGVVSIAYSSPTFERDLVSLLTERLGQPRGLRRYALMAFLRNGWCIEFYAFIVLSILISAFGKGLFPWRGHA